MESRMQEFVIPSMSCGGCVSRITQTIESVDAHATIKVNLASKTVEVDSTQHRASFAAALSGAGYAPAEPAPASSSTATNPGSARGGCGCGCG
jgi:copper chaperone